ncbi:transglycosylase [Arthrobacter sp. HY1533]|uniref:aggregation-promoting factor C-terminal-like domain-containing protein n=1 Tax=Arthrobacter sp. HY1533 TaxID=2970919 RepID=UPI0022B9EA50|nr:transglycosylase [Arthrobacter sp. HY1533]
MSSAPQRGRRRAESTRRPSLFGFAPARAGSRAAAPKAVTATAKCMAGVAIVGALVAASAVAQQVGSPASDAQANDSLSSLVSAVDKATQPAAVSAPSDAAIKFSDLSVTSSASPTPAATTPAPVKAEAESVTPEATAPAAAKAAAPVVVDDPEAAKAYAAGQMAAHGWGADQMSCLNLLWQRESEWLTSAENASSGAYGIAQSLPAEKMASTGSDWATNYQTQIRWGLSYIEGRYGSPCGAWGHSESVGWY